MNLKNLVLLVISTVIAYIIHMKFSVDILGSFVLFINPFISAAVFLTFLGLQILTVFLFLKFLERGFKNKKWYFVDYEIKIIKYAYILITILALYGRGLFTTRTSFSFDLSTFFAFDSNTAVIAFIFNLLWFAPLGLFTDWSFKKTFGLFIILELIQVVLRCGIFDINDLILYSIAFFIGRGLKQIKQKSNYKLT